MNICYWSFFAWIQLLCLSWINNTYLRVQSNPNQSIRRSTVQCYFPYKVSEYSLNKQYYKKHVYEYLLLKLSLFLQEWKVINPYHVHVRRKSPASAHLVKMSLQLYQVKADPYAHPFKPVTIIFHDSTVICKYFTGAEFINKFQPSVTTQLWNKALWLDVSCSMIQSSMTPASFCLFLIFSTNLS